MVPSAAGRRAVAAWALMRLCQIASAGSSELRDSGDETMQCRKIGLCHQNRLLSECLGESLSSNQDLTCISYLPDSLAAAVQRESGVVPTMDLLLLDAGLSCDLVDHLLDVVRELQPECKVLLLISERSADRMIELARLGSHGCLFEDASVQDVRDAITTVLSGQTFCSPQLANSLLAQIGRVDHGKLWSQPFEGVQLTSREREILGLISRERLCNKQIARRLNVSLYTIKNHVHNIIEKLGAQDRYDAAEIGRRRKLLGERPMVPIGAFS